MISVGAEGVISVASNIVPREMSDMVRAALAGDFAAARAAHMKFYPLFHTLFIDTNPVMVKEALWLLGRIERVFRLPLCETTEANLAAMKSVLQKVGLL
jgi:4-hydroxy-tetrahydrodipicolinate synthase